MNDTPTPPWEGHHTPRDQMRAELNAFMTKTIGVNLTDDPEGLEQLDNMTDAMLECFDYIVVHGKSPLFRSRREETDAELSAAVVAELEKAGVEGDIASHIGNIIRNASDSAARAFAWQLQIRPRNPDQERRLVTLRDSLGQASALLFGQNLDLDWEQPKAYPKLPSMKGRRGEMSAEKSEPGAVEGMIPFVGQIDVFPDHPDFIPCDGRKVFAEDYPDLHYLFKTHKPEQVVEEDGKEMLVMPDLTGHVMQDDDPVVGKEN